MGPVCFVQHFTLLVASEHMQSRVCMRSAGAALLVRRGSCTYLQKAQHAQDANGSLLIVYNDEDDCLRMGVNASREALDALQLVSVSVSEAAGLALAQAAEDGEGVSVWMPRCELCISSCHFILSWLILSMKPSCLAPLSRSTVHCPVPGVSPERCSMQHLPTLQTPPVECGEASCQMCATAC
jgi:hypothetical protein